MQNFPNFPLSKFASLSSTIYLSDFFFQFINQCQKIVLLHVIYACLLNGPFVCCLQCHVFKGSKNVLGQLSRGFINGRAPGKLTDCEHDFAWLLYISKNFFLLHGTIKNSFKLQ